ncbi:hypothetical protein AC249_AIPGENE23593 [Exaiptasia diaphana]|nr:hypothetical protein AC249_AIPGENE23593 [Exaiptasia diaphana]
MLNSCVAFTALPMRSYPDSRGRPSDFGRDRNSITTLSFTTDGGQSNLVFKRKLDTGDSQLDVAIVVRFNMLNNVYGKANVISGLLAKKCISHYWV